MGIGRWEGRGSGVDRGCLLSFVIVIIVWVYYNMNIIFHSNTSFFFMKTNFIYRSLFTTNVQETQRQTTKKKTKEKTIKNNKTKKQDQALKSEYKRG